jgi:hypothetical protein
VSPAPKEITEKYLPIWRDLFMKENAISEDYYGAHIRVVETGLSTDKSRRITGDRGREYFEVVYRINIDWIQLNVADHLVIRRKNEQRYLNIDEFLAEEENAKVQSRKVSRFISIDKAPMSFEEAVRRLKQINADAQCLKPYYLTLRFKSPSYDTDKIANGGVLLYGEGVIDLKKNQAVEGWLNLVTGKGSTRRVDAYKHSF